MVMTAAQRAPLVLDGNRRELFYAASELILSLPFAVRQTLEEHDPNGELMRRREQLPDLAELSPLRARAVLAIGAIAAVLQEILPPDGSDRVLSFTAHDDGVVECDGRTTVWAATRSAAHIAEIAVIPTDAAREVWGAFIHVLTEHWPHDTYFGYTIEHADNDVRLRRTTLPPPPPAV